MISAAIFGVATTRLRTLEAIIIHFSCILLTEWLPFDERFEERKISLHQLIRIYKCSKSVAFVFAMYV